MHSRVWPLQRDFTGAHFGNLKKGTCNLLLHAILDNLVLSRLCFLGACNPQRSSPEIHSV